MLNCDKGDMACNGGYLDVEWDFLQETGITTDSCTPYKSGDSPSRRFSCLTRCNDNSDFKLYKAASGSVV